MRYFVCAYKWLEKLGHGCIHLSFAGKWIVVTLEAKIISKIAEK